MLKILWKRRKIAPEEQFLPLSTIFYYLMLDFYVKTGIRFSLRDKRLFEITEVEITRVYCICLKTSKDSIERISVGSVIEKLAEHGIHCLPCSSTTEVIHFYNNLKILMMSK